EAEHSSGNCGSAGDSANETGCATAGDAGRAAQGARGRGVFGRARVVNSCRTSGAGFPFTTQVTNGDSGGGTSGAPVYVYVSVSVPVVRIVSVRDERHRATRRQRRALVDERRRSAYDQKHSSH